MRNLEFQLRLANDSIMPREIMNGGELIRLLFGDDFGPPPTGVVIVADSGKGFTIRIGLELDSGEPHVQVESSEGWKKCRHCNFGTIYQLDVPSGRESTRRCEHCGGLGWVEDH